MQETILLLAVLATATLSGTLGMGGGLLLLGAYLLVLPVPAAMVLHGVTQLASNGSRFILLRRHVDLPGLVPYAAGALLAVVLLARIGVVLDKATVYLLLGGIPLAFAVCRWRPDLSFARRTDAFACGASVTAAQLCAGASGPLLDVFFLDGRLDRLQVVATKALTQSAGHCLKLVYFILLVPVAGQASLVAWWLYPATVATAFAGTWIGRHLLLRLSDEGFLVACRRLIVLVSCAYVARGAAGLFGSAA